MNTSPTPESASVIQAYGSVNAVRLGLDKEVCYKSVASLNRLLAHCMATRDLYKKAHWQTSGAMFHQLHLLFDKHHQEQVTLIDALAERVQTLGGVALALAHDVVEESRIARAPRGREAPHQQLELVLAEARPMARQASEIGDDGTNDLIVSQVVRTHELQSWLVGEHLFGPEHA
jgi:starvation-inducible DNA-binding protein